MHKSIGGDLSDLYGVNKIRSNVDLPFIIKKLIGRGSSSKVYLAKIKYSKKLVAVKTIPFRKVYNVSATNNINSLYTESNILKKLHHSGIPKFYGVCQDTESLHIIEEYIDGEELFDMLIDEKITSEEMAKIYVTQLIHIVKYLHENNVVHRDIKPENIIIEKKTNRLVLVDYAFAIMTFKNKNNEEIKLSQMCGTLGYIAPEIYSGNKYYGKPVDIWSLGVTMYNIICGDSMPFPCDDFEIHDFLIRGDKINYDFVPDVFRPVFEKIFILDYNKRITIDEIIKNSWLNSGTINNTDKNNSNYDAFNNNSVRRFIKHKSI